MTRNRKKSFVNRTWKAFARAISKPLFCEFCPTHRGARLMSRYRAGGLSTEARQGLDDILRNS